MSIHCKATAIPGVILVEPEIFPDARGVFLEIYHQQKYFEAGIRAVFVQDNFSSSVRNTLRGLHFQRKRPQAKLVTVTRGLIFDVAVDIRPMSPTFGNWVGEYLSEENRRQLFIPEGFAHGFCVMTDYAEVLYKCSDFYDPGDDGGIFWSDPDIGITWPVKAPILSEKDKRHPMLQGFA